MPLNNPKSIRDLVAIDIIVGYRAILRDFLIAWDEWSKDREVPLPLQESIAELRMAVDTATKEIASQPPVPFITEDGSRLIYKEPVASMLERTGINAMMTHTMHTISTKRVNHYVWKDDKTRTLCGLSVPYNWQWGKEPSPLPSCKRCERILSFKG